MGKISHTWKRINMAQKLDKKEMVKPDELIASVLIDLNNRGAIRMGPKMRRYLSQYN